MEQLIDASTANREILLERLFNAPPALVFAAWTTPEHLAHWYGPNGFTITVHDIDLRVGGTFRLTMHGPDGRDYNNRIVYTEVDPPHRLVYKNTSEPGSESISFETTLTFTEENGKTRLKMRQLFPTSEIRNMLIEKHNVVEGGRQTFARLAEYIEPYSTTNTSHPLPEMHLVRTFNAPRNLVFAAWTEAKHLSQWWGPTGFTNPRCEIDLRVGGAIRIDMRGPDGVTYPMDGEFQEIVPPSRLVMLTGALNADGKRLFQVLNTITFTALGDKTQVAIHARVTKKFADDVDRYFRGMNIGWGTSLDKLAAHLESQQS